MSFSALRNVMFTASILLASAAAALAGDDGSISPKVAKSLRDSVKIKGSTRALQNALTAADAKTLAVNRAILQGHNNVFNHKIKAKGITNQKSSGRCWLFASLNILRPAVIEKYKLEGFEFSQSYLAFWDKLEKANCFLEFMIELGDRKPLDRELDFFVKDPIPDGGWWRYVVALVDKYGVMPQEIMPETYSSEHTSTMNKILQNKLRVDAVKLRGMVAKKKPMAEIRAAKQKMLAEVYRILVLNYGRPPSEFSYRYVDKDKKVSEMKKYTPQSFYKEWVGEDLSQYVNLCNDPTQPYNKHYRMRRIKNIMGTPEMYYVNVPIKVLKDLAAKALMDDQPVLFAADAGKDMDREKGIMQLGLYDYASIYGVDLKLSKADSLRVRHGVANHAMVFIGVDMQDKKPVKWLVENSWGKDRGKGGFWTMYDKWFDEHLYSIIVKKAYVPNDVLKIYNEKAVELAPWSSMNLMCR